jgi:Fe-Mn family superoxide dismutase
LVFYIQMLEPIEIFFSTFEPIIKEKQTEAHYKGHYLKYVNNLNKFIKENKTLTDIYHESIKSAVNKKFKKIFLLTTIQLFDKNSDIVHNAAQIYNHELYWSSITSFTKSIESFCNNKKSLFDSDNYFNIFYDKYLELGTKHFGSGWLWIIYNDNKLDIITTHDAFVPLEHKILAVIDLWEHAYYLDYMYERKTYLEKSFKLLNWNKINDKVKKIIEKIE